MCKKLSEGGQRCAAHTREPARKAFAAVQDGGGETARIAATEAVVAYATTAEGHDYIENELWWAANDTDDEYGADTAAWLETCLHQAERVTASRVDLRRTPTFSDAGPTPASAVDATPDPEDDFEDDFEVVEDVECVECGQLLDRPTHTGLCRSCFIREFIQEGRLMGMNRKQARVWAREQADQDVRHSGFIDFDDGDDDYDPWNHTTNWNNPFPALDPSWRSPSTYPLTPPRPTLEEQARTTGKPVRSPLGRAGSGDGYVYFPDGSRRWGLYGASGVLIRHTDDAGTERFFLGQRGNTVEGGGGTWSIPGGALDENETPTQGALREFHEEIRAPIELTVHAEHTVPFHEEWAYTTVVTSSPTLFTPPTKLDWETTNTGWFTLDELRELPLLPAFADALPDLLNQYDTQTAT